MNGFLKTFLFILIPALGLEALNFSYFLVAPEKYYYRSWEYFTEFVYRKSSIPTKWNGIETSDLTRQNTIYYQDPHKTLVTIDSQGFRSTPTYNGPTNILIGGDSTTFGSGLSDQDTLPWQVGDQLKQNIFNGARVDILNAILNPELKEVKAVVECLTERNFTSSFFKNKWPDKFTPLRKENLSWLELLEKIPPDRYLISKRLVRLFKQLKQDYKISRGKTPEEPLLYFPFTHIKDDFEPLISKLTKRSEMIEAKGLTYFICVVPGKQSIYPKNRNIDEYSLNFIKTLHQRLDEEGIRYINLYDTFREFKQDNPGQLIFRKFDTHWNEVGTKISSDLISEELEQWKK